MSAHHIKIGMTPSHPGAFILDEILTPLDLSLTEAAKALGVHHATLSDLVNGEAALSAKMACESKRLLALGWIRF